MLHLISVVGEYADVLPHMLSHYQSLGIDDFIIHAHATSSDDPILAKISTYAAEVGAVVASTSIVPWITSLNSVLYTISRSEYSDDWFIIADQDELQSYPDNLRSIIRYCDQNGYTFIEGSLVDRLSLDGKLNKVNRDQTIWEQFPLGSMLSGALLGAVTNKIVAVKGSVRLEDGQHRGYSGFGCPPQSVYVPVNHFKWVEDIDLRMERRIALNRKFRNPATDLYTYECDRFLRYYKQEGCIRIDDPNLMVARCNPDYPHWDRVKEWRSVAHFFAPDLALNFHRKSRREALHRGPI